MIPQDPMTPEHVGIRILRIRAHRRPVRNLRPDILLCAAALQEIGPAEMSQQVPFAFARCSGGAAREHDAHFVRYLGKGVTLGGLRGAYPFHGQVFLCGTDDLALLAQSAQQFRQDAVDLRDRGRFGEAVPRPSVVRRQLLRTTGSELLGHHAVALA